MSPWQVETYQQANEYANMRLFFTCWACGRSMRDRPSNWYAPWLIERAHIVSKPRIEDRRCVVMLCSLCHKISHGERFSGLVQPKLERPHLLWIKRRIDPLWYDPELLAKCVIGLLPELERPPRWYGENQMRLLGKAWAPLSE